MNNQLNFSILNTLPRACGLLLVLLMYSCAQVVVPTGGEIDKTSPKVVAYSPDSAALNFNTNVIQITFNELIQLKDVSGQLIISPPLSKIPDIKVKGKVLTIEMDAAEKLKPNTTYAFNLGNAIQDIHEGNALENFKYIFSTGTYIDSLTLNGFVKTAFDFKTEKGILVMLYSDYNDSVIYNTLPDFFAKTADDGSFKINNIRPGKYKLMALKDANNDYKYSGDNESIGFADTLIDISQNKTASLVLFQEPQKKLFIKNTYYNSFGKMQFVLNKPNDGIQIMPLNYTFKNEDVWLDFSKNKDTLTYWFRNIDKDSLDLEIVYNDRVLDTLAFKIIKREESLKNSRSPLRFNLINSFSGNQNVELNSEFALTFSNPIDAEWLKKNENVKIELFEDSLVYAASKQLTYELKSLNTIVIKQKNADGTKSALKLKENTPYHFTILPHTFTDIFGLSNDSIFLNFKTREEKQYGSIKLKLDVPQEIKGNYIVQLLDEKENILRTNVIQKSEAVLYPYVLPQKYKLKIICDENANLKWDTGNLHQKQQPEKVIYNAEIITARASWDLELEWKLQIK